MNDTVGVCIQCTEEQAEALAKLFRVVKIVRPKEREAPTLENILAFCKSRNSPVDGLRFFNYYDERGWVDGKGDKIEDWRKKLIEWENNGNSNRPRSNSRQMTAAEYNATGGGKPSAYAIEQFIKWDDEQKKKEGESA